MGHRVIYTNTEIPTGVKVIIQKSQIFGKKIVIIRNSVRVKPQKTVSPELTLHFFVSKMKMHKCSMVPLRTKIVSSAERYELQFEKKQQANTIEDIDRYIEEACDRQKLINKIKKQWNKLWKQTNFN